MDTMVNCTDEQNIIKMLNERSEQGLSELSSRYGKVCGSIAYNILDDKRDVEEILNDTWLAVWNSIPPKSPDPLSAYVYRIVKNLSLKKLRHRSADKRSKYYEISLEELMECMPSVAPDSSSDEENSGLTDVVERFLHTLSKRNRVVFVKKYWYFKTVSDISEETKMSETSIKVLLHRLRKQLKAFIEKEGIRI